jgi:integrase
VTLHTFRHTCASLLFAPVEHGGGGKNAKQVQEWLGHHSPAYTLKEYVHLIDAGVGVGELLRRRARRLASEMYA